MDCTLLEISLLYTKQQWVQNDRGKSKSIVQMPIYMVNAVRFLERVQSLWDGISRVNFMEVNGLTGVGQSEWRNWLHRLS